MADQPVGTGPGRPPAGSGRGPGSPDLASSPAEKNAAARAIEQHIEPGTQRAGRRAAEDTGTAVTAFGAKDGDGWATATALAKALTVWGDQLKNLMDRLASEKDALRAGDNVLTGTDLAVGGTAREISVLDRF
ncbi:hypothetical protein [Streptomyces abyssomicinicus]|uniref:hypothetical protein n=1 Tax=Streptomyces abyssomicinicus TaxID=574929 RepID=UPI001FECC2C8|nr:hypothetical protein [Streptomyces abyssomicinicus]